MLGERILRRHAARLPWIVRYLLGKAAIGGVNVVIDRHHEYAFVVKCLADGGIRGKRILEIGCCGSYLPLVMAAMGNRVTGVDLYPWDVKHPGLEMVTGSILELDFAAEFDVAVAVSVIEHIGLSRYDEQTKHLDRTAVARIRSLLVHDGHFILSVPYGQRRVFPKYHRVYDREGFAALVDGFEVVRQEFFAPLGKSRNVEPCSEEETHRFGRSPLPYAITCAHLRKSA